MIDRKKIWHVKWRSVWPTGETVLHKGGVFFNRAVTQQEAADLLKKRGCLDLSFPNNNTIRTAQAAREAK